jgi:hypothetical protein
LIDQVVDALGFEVKRGNGRKDHRAHKRSGFEIAQVHKMQRRFTKKQDQSAALFEGDVGGTLNQ